MVRNLRPGGRSRDLRKKSQPSMGNQQQNHGKSWDFIADFMEFYSDSMGFIADLMEAIADFMEFMVIQWDIHGIYPAW